MATVVTRTCHKNITITLPVVLLISPRELLHITLLSNRWFLLSLIFHERLHLLLETIVQETSACKCIAETEQNDALIVWESFLYTSISIWVKVGFLGFQWVIPHVGQENALRKVYRSLDTIPCHLSVDKAKTISSTSLQNYHSPNLIKMPCEGSEIKGSRTLRLFASVLCLSVGTTDSFRNAKLFRYLKDRCSTTEHWIVEEMPAAEDEGSAILQNVGNHTPVYTA
jgi:hypothetical protein